MFRRLGLLRVLGLSFVFMAVLASGMGIFGFFLLSKVTHLTRLQDYYRVFLQREIDHLNWVLKARSEVTSHQRLSVQTDPTQCHLGRWIYEGGMDQLRGEFPDLQETLNRLESHHRELHAVGAQIADALETGDYQKAQELAYAQLEIPLSRVRENLKEIRDRMSAEVSNLGDNFVSISRFFKVAFGTYLLVFWVIALGLGLWQSRYVSGIFKALIDQSKTLIFSFRKDIQILDRTNQAFKVVVDEQSSSSQATAASVTEIEMLSTRNASTSEQIQQAAERIAQSVEVGFNAVNELKGVSQNLIDIGQNLWQQTEENVNELNSIVDIFKSIEQKIESIHEIVFQTRLLSFNASVEAARAGAHGAGFSVVAEEVRKLADMSGQVAAEISQLIVSSQKQVEDIIKTINERFHHLIQASQSEIQVSFEKAGVIYELFNQFKAEVEQVVQMIYQFNSSLNEQKIGLSEISKAVHKVNKSIELTRQSMAEMQLAVAELKSQMSASNEFLRQLHIWAYGESSGVKTDATLSESQDTAETQETVSPNSTFQHDGDDKGLVA